MLICGTLGTVVERISLRKRSNNLRILLNLKRRWLSIVILLVVLDVLVQFDVNGLGSVAGQTGALQAQRTTTTITSVVLTTCCNATVTTTGTGTFVSAGATYTTTWTNTTCCSVFATITTTFTTGFDNPHPKTSTYTSCCSSLTTIIGMGTFVSAGTSHTTTWTNTSCVLCSATTTTISINRPLAALTTDVVLLVTAAAAIGVAGGYVLSKRELRARPRGPKGTPNRRSEKGL